MLITTWFDPTNRDHLEAYKHLQAKGVWPDGFIPSEMEFPVNWVYSIALAMSDCWLEYKLGRPTASATTRAEGYYWVLLDDRWMVAKWSTNKKGGWWDVPGSEIDCSDDAFDWIDELRITR